MTFFDALCTPDDRVALRVGDAQLTHRELSAAAAAHLARLADAGVRPGDRVGTWTHPGLEAAVALVAHAAGGLVSVPLNPKLGPKERDHILRDAAPVAMVAPPSAGVDGALEIRVETDGAGLRKVAEADDGGALVLYTSGTTGPPKGAVLSRRNCAFDVDALARAWEWTDADTVVHALPLFHVHGLVLGLFGALRAGGALHWVPRFDPATVAAALRPGGTMLFSVPTMVHRLADAAEQDAGVRAGLAAARLLVSGSAGLPVREHKRIEALAGRGMLERYGLTETLINCGVRAATGPMPGQVGPPLEGVELKLVDDTRAVLDAHDDETILEVAVRGPNVFSGYLNRPDATEKVLDDEGWFYTGDLATRDERGAIRIVGRRATDLIKTGGFKVGAGEVEAAILEVPGVAEVAVIGVPDADLGEQIVAYVVPRPGVTLDPDAVREHVAGQLTPHKRPRQVHLREALPRNAMGKVVKPRLRTEPGS
ncbi:MAG: AMP-binding protein [Sandaracinaceae bacterium]